MNIFSFVGLCRERQMGDTEFDVENVTSGDSSREKVTILIGLKK